MFTAEVRSDKREIANHKALSMNRGGFFVFGVGSGIANVRISKSNDLLGIRRISEDFLVPRHRGIENDFTDGNTICPDGHSAEHCPIF
ncbi:Uncharacterised protein [Vibrio cholerae]|uniref:Uncharacterized protein n=1 Tax=Vibrio cholerae TaxID=666 RepID=A0A655W819_VIBCL|nr:Uncharacterised protein [Vibrio cholerae]CSB45536.1 Uncharacterised protein [Vibrio cholerae]CSB83267.1 Uncharacterised protein [Vibrio cholerae]CSC78147.1 Uncharacterised protein [Vibrio cholerae]